MSRRTRELKKQSTVDFAISFDEFAAFAAQFSGLPEPPELFEMGMAAQARGLRRTASCFMLMGDQLGKLRTYPEASQAGIIAQIHRPGVTPFQHFCEGVIA